MLRRHELLLLSTWLGVLFLAQFWLVYGLLLELHPLTQAAHSYALLHPGIYRLAILQWNSLFAHAHAHAELQCLAELRLLGPLPLFTWIRLFSPSLHPISDHVIKRVIMWLISLRLHVQVVRVCVCIVHIYLWVQIGVFSVEWFYHVLHWEKCGYSKLFQVKTCLMLRDENRKLKSLESNLGLLHVVEIRHFIAYFVHVTAFEVL